MAHRLLALGAGLAIVSAVPAASFAAFPGDDGVIAFTRYAIGNLSGQVATAPNEEDAEVTLLTPTPVPLNAVPTFSPDGTCIAFYSERDAGNRELYVMAADGSDQTRMTVHPAFDYIPSWSPDGRQLAFASDRDGDMEIYLFDLETGATVQLTENTAEDVSPVFSPDGTQIAFTSFRDGDYEIYTMGADGEDEKRRTESVGFDGYPDWSPDGTTIVFASQREGTLGRDIWVMNADGENQTALVTQDGGDSDPAYSPTGKYVAFTGGTGAAGHLFVVESSGSGLVQVTDSEIFDDRGPDWQPLTEPGEKQLCPTITPKVCGDANLDAEVKATDALVVLKKAVGQNVVCPKIRCDTDDSGVVLASDAQRTLRFAVGQDVTLDCPDVELP